MAKKIVDTSKPVMLDPATIARALGADESPRLRFLRRLMALVKR